MQYCQGMGSNYVIFNTEVVCMLSVQVSTLEFISDGTVLEPMLSDKKQKNMKKKPF